MQWKKKFIIQCINIIQVIINLLWKYNIKIVSASIKQILKNKQEFEKLIKKNLAFAYTSSEDKIINKYNGKLFTHIYTDFGI